MRRKILRLFLFFAAAALCTFAFADLGDFNDYGDSGGWSSDSSSDSSSGGGSSDWDSDFGGGGIGHGRYSNKEILFIFLVLGIIATVKYGLFGSGKSEKSDSSRDVPYMPDYTSDIAKAVSETDPDFSENKFLEWSKEVFITLQTAWSERDWEKVRPFEKEELYRQHELQIKKYIDSGRINVLERININNAYLFRYRREAEYEFLTVFMNTRMTDYIIDEKTREVLKGDPNTDSYMRYLYTFMRKKGVLTSAAQAANTVECPKCGAPARVTSAGRCEYCGFIVKTGDFSWVLSDIEGIKHGAYPGPGGVIINDKKE